MGYKLYFQNEILKTPPGPPETENSNRIPPPLIPSMHMSSSWKK